MKPGQGALPLPFPEPSEAQLRAAFEGLSQSGRVNPDFSFEQAVENPALRLCLRNLAEARARAKAGMGRCER